MPGSFDFGQLFEHSPNAYMVLDRELRFVAANRAYLKVTSMRLESLLGHRVFDVFPDRPGEATEGVRAVQESFARVLATGQPDVLALIPYCLPRHLPDGSVVPEEHFWSATHTPLSDERGEVRFILQHRVDVTELQQLREAARTRAEAAERRQRFLAEAIPQQVWTAAPDGRLDFVSDRVADYFGTSREQILGDGWQHVIHPDDLPSAVAAWTRALQTGEEYEAQFRLRRHDGAYRWHLGRARPMRDHRGAVVQWYGTNTDIDEGRRARDELEERAKFEQQLIGIVSHDLRNPLSAIGVAASLLLRRGNLDDQQGKTIGRMVSLVERTGRMIRDFLDFTQARSAGFIPIAPAPADLRQIVREVVDEVHLSHPEREVVVEHRGEATGRWDPDRLAQVVGNLVANAFQHSQPPAVVRVSTRVEGQSAELEVQNDGPPIPEADLKKLFAPFQRGEGARATSARSVGLGLYITFAIVAAHGGRIEVDSSAERGTRFIVRLPREVAPRPGSGDTLRNSDVRPAG